MKRLIAITLTLLAILPLSASFSVITPSRPHDSYAIMADNGDILPLDDHVWLKRWNGLTAEQMDTGIYRIEDDGNFIWVITGPVDPLTLDRLFRFESGITTIITPDTRYLAPEDIADTGCRVVVSGKRMSALNERIFRNEGVDVEYYRSGDIIDIENGVPVNGSGTDTILITCPCCGNRFTISI